LLRLRPVPAHVALPQGTLRPAPSSSACDGCRPCRIARRRVGVEPERLLLPGGIACRCAGERGAALRNRGAGRALNAPEPARALITTRSVARCARSASSEQAKPRPCKRHDRRASSHTASILVEIGLWPTPLHVACGAPQKHEASLRRESREGAARPPQRRTPRAHKRAHDEHAQPRSRTPALGALLGRARLRARAVRERFRIARVRSVGSPRRDRRAAPSLLVAEPTDRG
jgi:hypothetical protein